MPTNRYDSSATKAPEYRFALFLLVLGAACLASEAVTDRAKLDTLLGPLPSTVPGTGRPYLVTGDIEVPPGEVVHIEPGVILLFEEFTGLNIYGVLKAQGTAQRPVYFTSAHDPVANISSSVKPAAYDWNGITVTQSGVGTHLSNCSVRYSLFGISTLTDKIFINSCTFKSNGKSDLVVNGEKLRAGAGPYSFGSIEEVTPEIDTVRVPVETVERPLPRKPIIRYSSLALFVAGTAVAAWQGREYREARREFIRVNNDTNPDNLKQPDIDDQWDDARMRRDRTLLGTALAGGTALLGVIGFSVSFVL